MRRPKLTQRSLASVAQHNTAPSPQPAPFYQNEKSLQCTFRAEKMTLQKHLYTKFSTKRRNPKTTSRSLASVAQH